MSWGRNLKSTTNAEGPCDSLKRKDPVEARSIATVATKVHPNFAINARRRSQGGKGCAGCAFLSQKCVSHHSSVIVTMNRMNRQTLTPCNPDLWLWNWQEFAELCRLVNFQILALESVDPQRHAPLVPGRNSRK